MLSCIPRALYRQVVAGEDHDHDLPDKSKCMPLSFQPFLKLFIDDPFITVSTAQIAKAASDADCKDVMSPSKRNKKGTLVSKNAVAESKPP